MEIEVKLRLPTPAAHASLTALLAPSLLATHHQNNLFFDTASSHLLSRRSVLRLRFYNPDRCVVSLKGKAVIKHGVSRVEEDEEEIELDVGRQIIHDPNQIWGVENRVLERVRGREFGVGEGERWVCLGGFENVRRVYRWNGLRLEVDETGFEFGTLYEVECESEDPERAKGLIEGFLREKGIGYDYSVMSKFAIFRAGKLPE
ncbi:hypothetical protein Droror1_Dr00021367 [Drosera rotundifolia]